ncbi:hypothetical protein BGZ96_009382 [Linnemannia gamsii]|uniref:Uncharacterized protein n=1 Tax=Linnemannia gamsii TaxID=64522 RepID=A0ABQ7JWV6_9FUNG|nr:hypothetical protein BGZ96_009382 [Linnemannia gamsii]
MTAAEVMASLGRSVNNLEQLHRQQLQQLSAESQHLHLSLVNGGHTSLESADSTTPSTPASITATIISALLRSTATAMSLTCGTENHLQPHLSPYSASTTPAIPCSDVFSEPKSNEVADDKPGFEPNWKESFKKDVDTESKALKIKDASQSAHKDKQKDLGNSDDGEGIYQREQEFGHFSTAEPFDTEDDAWREYRDMMYSSSNYPPPYSAMFGSGGGESSRSTSRRSSIFNPTPSPPALVSYQIAPTTIVVNHTKGKQGLTELEEEEAELPFWAHFYTLDALQSTICHRLATALDAITFFKVASSFHLIALFFIICIGNHNFCSNNIINSVFYF